MVGPADMDAAASRRVATPPGRFRTAGAADVPAVMEVRLAVRENVLSDPSRVTPEICLEYLSRRGRGWVCELEGRVVGFSIADGDKSSIWALFLLPEVEGRGIGSRLLALAVDWLFSLGHDTVTLSTTAGTRADRFYSAHGWERGALDAEGEVAFTLRRPAG